MASDSFLRLTPAELREMTGELLDVLRRWADAHRDEPLSGERESVFLFFHAFPERTW